MTLPIGTGETLKGVVSLLNNKAFEYSGVQGEGKEIPLPPEMADEIQTYRENLIEHLAEADDALIEKFLEGQELSSEELALGLRKGVLQTDLYAGLLRLGLKEYRDRSAFGGHQHRSAFAFGSRAPNRSGPQNESREEKGAFIETPFSALAFKTLADPYAGRLTIFRVFSGEITADSGFYNVNKGVRERFGQLFALEGKTQKPIPAGYPGNILAVAKLKETVTGDTLADEKDPILFPFITAFLYGHFLCHRSQKQGRRGQGFFLLDPSDGRRPDHSLGPGFSDQGDHPLGHGSGPCGNDHGKIEKKVRGGSDSEAPEDPLSGNHTSVGQGDYLSAQKANRRPGAIRRGSYRYLSSGTGQRI